jgi:tRNA 2-selenouridine synthase SelU
MCDPTDKTIEEAAAKIAENLLPQKSRKIYEKCYQEFCDWCLMKKVDEIHSESVLLVYFAKKAKHFKASTLWSHYSMIKSSFEIKVNVDISKYSKLVAFLKRQNVGYQAKKSKTLTKEQIERFLTEGPDEMYLMANVNFKYAYFKCKINSYYFR